MLRDQVYPLSSRFKISIGHSSTPILILPTAAAFSAERNSAVQVSERRLSPLYFNITSDRGIRNAPVKSQCSKHYFYGRDLEVEKILQEIEGRYSRFIQDITGTGYKLKPSDSLLAKRFMFLQYSRTEMAMSRRAQSF